MVRKRETRADASKKSRRQNARRWTVYTGTEALQKKKETRLERLECTNATDVVFDGDFQDGGNESDSDEFVKNSSSSDEDISDEEKVKTEKVKRKATNGKGKTKKKDKRIGAAKLKRKKTLVNKQIRSLGQILMDEYFRKTESGAFEELPYMKASAAPSRYPCATLCVVSGVLARYTDPESHLPYANSKVFDTLKEQPPPWLKASVNTPFHDALRLIEEEHEKKMVSMRRH